MKSSSIIFEELQSLIGKLDDGARLPTVRDLMKQFSASQSTVQTALNQLREAGQLSSEVGRGTFVAKGAGISGRLGSREKLNIGADQPLNSYLLLSSSRLNERSVLVQNGIQSTVSADRINVVQMSYQNTDQVLEILRNAPKFGAAILQSHFETIPIRLLNLLQEKSKMIIADGHSLSGIDIDRVGTDWTEAMDDAVDHLVSLGHRKLGLITIDGHGRPILAARRYFSRLSNWRGTGLELHPPLTLNEMTYPAELISDSMTSLLKSLISEHGKLPFTALIMLGISDGSGVRQSFEELSISIPKDLSVHILGHCDVSSEHQRFFTISGPSYRDTIANIVNCVRERVKHPDMQPQILYHPVQRVLHTSTTAPNNSS